MFYPMNRMDIVACTDKWFVMPTGVMMYSVCVNNPDMDIVFHVITDRMNPDVLHFSTSEKPWHVYQRYPHPYSSTWYKYQDRTKWKGIKYEHRPFRLRAINFVADTLRRWQLKPQITMYDFIDIAPID